MNSYIVFLFRISLSVKNRTFSIHYKSALVMKLKLETKHKELKD